MISWALRAASPPGHIVFQRRCAPDARPDKGKDNKKYKNHHQRMYRSAQASGYVTEECNDGNREENNSMGEKPALNVPLHTKFNANGANAFRNAASTNPNFS